MPHLILEHSRAIASDDDLQSLSGALYDAAQAHPVFSAHPKAVKTRTICADKVRSGVTPETFAHLTVRLLSGRSAADKTDLAQVFLNVLTQALPKVGSLSVELVDMDRESYAKRVL